MTNLHSSLTSPNILGYVRRSKKGEQRISPQVQRQEVERFAAVHGLTIVGWFEDLGRSGFKPGIVREGWDGVMQRIEQGDIGAVVAYRADRFTRQGVRKVIQLGEEAAEHGTALLSATEPFDSRDKGMAQLMGLFISVNAESESLRISERVGKAKALIRDSGGFTGGKAPFGYEVYRGEDRMRRLRPNPTQAAVLNEAADKVLAGQSLRSVVAELNAAGRFNRDDRPWNDTSLRTALRNPVIAGYQTMRPSSKDDWTIVTDDAGDRRRPWEPVVSAAKHEQLRVLFSQRHRPIKSDRSFLGGRGLLICSSCGGPMNAIRMKAQPDVYRCSRFPQGMCVRSISIDWKNADEWVRAYVHGLVRHLDIANSEDYALILGAARLFNATVQDPTLMTRRQQVQDEMAELRSRIAEIDDQFVNADIDGARHRAIGVKLTKRLAKAEKRLAEIPTGEDDDVDGVMDWIEGLRDGDPMQWSDDDFFTLARYLIKGVIVLPYRAGLGRGNVDPRLLVVLNEARDDG